MTNDPVSRIHYAGVTAWTFADLGIVAQQFVRDHLRRRGLKPREVEARMAAWPINHASDIESPVTLATNRNGRVVGARLATWAGNMVGSLAQVRTHMRRFEQFSTDEIVVLFRLARREAA